MQFIYKKRLFREGKGALKTRVWNNFALIPPFSIFKEIHIDFWDYLSHFEGVSDPIKTICIDSRQRTAIGQFFETILGY